MEKKPSYVKIQDLSRFMKTGNNLHAFAYKYYWMEYNTSILKTIYLPNIIRIGQKGDANK